MTTNSSSGQPALSVLVGLWLVAGAGVLGAERSFQVTGVSVVLEEVSADVGVQYRSMRLNRAQGVWNAEMVLTNGSSRTIGGPLVVAIEGFSGTSGVVDPDGTDTSDPPRAYYDFSEWVAGGRLLPGQSSQARTISLTQVPGGVPVLSTAVFGNPQPDEVALAWVQTLDASGLPLAGVMVEEVSPAGTDSLSSDDLLGFASLGSGVGEFSWKFHAPGYVPVWRKQILDGGGVQLLPTPQLTRRSSSVLSVTPLGGMRLTDDQNGIAVVFPAGGVSRGGTANLTSLTGQTLPALLPLGWSPLQAFWLEVDVGIAQPVTAECLLWDELGAADAGALVHWNEGALHWEVAAVLSPSTAGKVSLTLPRVGAYAVVVADQGPTAPPAPVPGEPLGATNFPLPDEAELSASGQVDPPVRLASLEPEAVTARAVVRVAHGSVSLPSGLALRGETSETYRLRNGSVRTTPATERTFVGYRRPVAGEQPGGLHATFPLRPQLLFASEVLEEAEMKVEVFWEAEFLGAVLDSGGGQAVLDDRIRVVVAAGDLDRTEALRLRRLPADAYAAWLSEGTTSEEAFEIGVGNLRDGSRLMVQLSNLEPNTFFVLARAIFDAGWQGLEPVERLATDPRGKLMSLEPDLGERLPGLHQAGQYVLVRVSQPQALIRGVARNASGEPVPGLPVRLTGLPWLTLSGDGGVFRLVAPQGEAEMTVVNPATGDVGQAVVSILDVSATAVADLGVAAAGPQVVSVTPADGAQRVSAVTSVVVTFSEPINPRTFGSTGLRLLNETGSTVPGSLSLNLAGTRATFLPASPLNRGVLYRVELAPSIADPTGLALEGQAAFSFRTAPASVRTAGSQLIIYEPGATNVPPQILDDIPAYTPGEDAFAVVVHGTPGTADPEVPVILANESTGETATVLSKVDGSFSSVIRGAEDDFVSATFVNLNGTRVYVPVSRQEFDNGFVGLYPSGGILEAESDGGPVQVQIEPQAIRERTKFRIEAVGLSDILAFVKGKVPEDAQLLTGFRVEIEGDVPEGEANVSFPVDPSSFGFPADLSPEDAALALAVPQEIDGETVYQVVDKLRYEEGRVFSNTLPFLGFFAASLVTGAAVETGLDFMTTVLLFGGKPVVVTGRVLEEDKFGNESPLGGAFVSASPLTASIDRPGRIRPGMVYATSGRDGIFALVLPLTVGEAGVPFSKAPDHLLSASHPRHSRPVFKPLDNSSIGVNFFEAPYFERDLVFTPDTLINLGSSSPSIRMTAHLNPRFPGTNETTVLTVDAYSALAVPTVQFSVEAVASYTPDVAVTLGDVQLDNQADTGLGAGAVRSTVELRASQGLQALVKIVAIASGGGNQLKETAHMLVTFGGQPRIVADQLEPADLSETVGPGVVSMQPSPGGTLPAGQKLTLRFNEPVNRSSVFQTGAVAFTPTPLTPPTIELSLDQLTLEIFPGQFPDGTAVATLTLGSAIEDLNGNPFDQVPGLDGNQVFNLKFVPGTSVIHPVGGVKQGGGVVLHGAYAYVLDREGGGQLKVYEIDQLLLGAAAPLTTVPLPGYPRDLALIPDYAYQPSLHDPVVTQDLIAVVGGDAGSSAIDDLGNVYFRGQYLRVFDVSNPSAPRRVLGAQLSLRNVVVNRVLWRPPLLVYVESGADLQQVGIVDLQTMLIGFNATPEEIETFPLEGYTGKQVNANGTYVDPGEELPKPRRRPPEFFGKRFALALRDPGVIQDVAADASGYVGVVMSKGIVYAGEEGNQVPQDIIKPSYRTLMFDGAPLPEDLGIYFFELGARPQRVLGLLNQNVWDQGALTTRSLALAGLGPDQDGTNRVMVLDISQPTAPMLLDAEGIVLPDNLGTPKNLVQREDGLLGLAMSRDLVLIDPTKLLEFPPDGSLLHPAVVGIISGGGSGNRTLAQEPSGLNAVALGGRAQIAQSPPRLRFVSFPFEPSVVNPSTLVGNPAALETLLRGLTERSALPTGRATAEAGVASSLSPPSPAVHHHVLIDAPGASGPGLLVSLEGLNSAGYPLKNKGRGFPPVRAMSAQGTDDLKQSPRTETDAPSDALRAFRLSGDKTSPFYNLYLSESFALVQERLSLATIGQLVSQAPRRILWGGHFLRATLDPAEAVNPVVGAFAANVDTVEAVTRPGAFAIAETLPGDYVPGNNPPPVGGELMFPGTFGTINALNGEFRHTTVDAMLPSPRMPIVFQRILGGQDLQDGPFGPGWDFNYNQRLVELRPEVFPAGSQKPLVVRDTQGRHKIAGSGDVQFIDGEGHVILYQTQGNQQPEEFSEDPLAVELGWASTNGTYYLPHLNEKAVFDLLYRHPSGEFTRLTPGGTQYRYAPDGRLMWAQDRYPTNRHVLDYNERGELTRIVDTSVDADRFLELGYYRLAGDLQGNLDRETSSGFVAGKIAALSDYVGRVTDFSYTLDGVLERREGPITQSGEGGFDGRPTTIYLSKSPVYGQLQGVVSGTGTGGGGGGGGTPMFAADMQEGQGAEDKLIAASGNGAGGAVAVDVPNDNNAANTEGTPRSATLAEGSKTEVTYDGNGYPRQVALTGAGADPVNHQTTHNDQGLLERRVLPLGDTIEYTYDLQNKALRARANLLEVKRTPGQRGGDTLKATYSDYDQRYNLPKSHTDFSGNSITFSLTSDGRDVKSVDYGGGLLHEFDYNDRGLLLKEVTPHGVTWDYAYESDTYFPKSMNRGGLVTTMTYDDTRASKLGKPSKVSPPANDSIDLTYDARLLLLTTQRGGYLEQRSYDENGNVVRIKRNLGQSDYLERRTYGQNNFVEKIEIDHDGATLTTAMQPDGEFRVKKVTLPGGEVRQFTYDHLGHATSVTMGGYEITYERDLHGNVLKMLEGGDVTRQFEYDGHDRLLKEILEAEGPEQRVELTYFANGQVRARKAFWGDALVMHEENEVVDALGRAKSIAILGDQVNARHTIDYQTSGGSGATVTVRGPREDRTSKFDAAGRLSEFTTSIGTTSYGYDANSNLEEIRATEDGTSYTTTRTFNSLDHLLSQSDGEGTEFTLTPRLDGLATELTDGNNNVSRQTFSELGMLLETARPEGIQFKFSFDKNLQLSFSGDTADAGHDFEYGDGTLRLTKMTMRNGDGITYESPNAQNHPLTIGLPGGQMSRTYDRVGRPLSEDSSFSGVNYTVSDMTYDTLSRLRSVQYGSGSSLNTASYDYDLLGPLARAEYQESGQTFTVSYTIYNDGSTRGVSYADGTDVGYTRDNAGRLKSVSVGGTTILQVQSYEGAQLPTALLHGGLFRESNSYDKRKRLLQRRYERLSDGRMLADLRYRYDGANNVRVRQELHRNGRADVYVYDRANRLIRAGVSARPSIEGADEPSFGGFPLGGTALRPGRFYRTYSYGGDGLDLLQGGTLVNPQQFPVSGLAAASGSAIVVPAFAGAIAGHDDFLMATTVDGLSRASDGLGNTTATWLMPRATGDAEPARVAGTQLLYNGRSDLVRVERADGVSVDYEYQPGGLIHRRTVKRSNTTVSDRAWIWESGRLIEERDLSGGQVVGRYFYDDGDTPIAVDLPDAGGTLRRYYLLRDHNNSVVAVVDDSAEVIERVQYDPWGQPVIEARDELAPRVAQVVQASSDELWVVFTEPVMPPVVADSGPDLAGETSDLAGAVELTVGGATEAGDVTYVEAAPGFAFGSVVRVRAAEALSGPFTLTVVAGRFADEWGNPNVAESLTLASSQTSGDVIYPPSGAPMASTAPQRVARSTVGNPFLFHGQYLDYETGLVYLRARFYDPYTGQFLQRDPETYVDSVNPYAGLAHNPTSYRDPSGRLIGAFARLFGGVGRGIGSVWGRLSGSMGRLLGRMSGSVGDNVGQAGVREFADEATQILPSPNPFDNVLDETTRILPSNVWANSVEDALEESAGRVYAAKAGDNLASGFAQQDTLVDMFLPARIAAQANFDSGRTAIMRLPILSPKHDSEILGFLSRSSSVGPGWIDVVIHGDSKGFVSVINGISRTRFVDGKLVHDFSWFDVPYHKIKDLLLSKGYQGENIRLLSCNGATAPENLAKYLSEVFEVRVRAVRGDVLRVSSDGALKVGEKGRWVEYIGSFLRDL